MKKLLSKIWNTSPKYWFSYFYRKSKQQEIQTNEPNKPSWHVIKNGPAQNKEIFITQTAFEGWEQMLNGNYDRFMFKEIDNYANKVVWDIGAHFGYSSLVFSSLVGDNGKVFSFEPNKVNFERLKLNIEHNDIQNIQVSELALSDEITEIDFIASDDIEGSPSTGSHLGNIMAPKPDSLYESLGFIKYKVKTNTIDNLLATFPTPNILKIDVEGAEYNVLLGAKKLLSVFEVEILMEIHNILAMYDVLELLHKLNYKTKVLDRNNASISRTFLHCWK